MSEGAFSADEMRSARIAVGLSQAAAAVEIGVTVNTVGRWERGVNSPRGIVAQNMRRTYGLEELNRLPESVETELRRRVETLEAQVQSLLAGVVGSAADRAPRRPESDQLM